MANHAYVYTQKPLTKEGVRAVLDRMNQEYFFGLMQIEEGEWADSNEPLWTLTFEGAGDQDYNYRNVWIANEYKFEVRHGGGPVFLWWVDSLVQDEIAREFDGMVYDDGTGWSEDGKTWDTPFTFKGHLWKRPQRKREIFDALSFNEFVMVLKQWMYGTPKQYMRALKKKEVLENQKANSSNG